MKTVPVFSSLDDNWDPLVASVESVQKGSMDKAEEWRKSFIRPLSRRSPMTFSSIHVSLLALRVKPHLHRMWTDTIVAAYSESLGIEFNNLVMNLAIKLLTDDSLFLPVNGRRACLDALSQHFVSVGASNRVKQPDGPMGDRVVFATLGHVAFVVNKVRNVLETAAGIRSSTAAVPSATVTSPCGWRRCAACSRSTPQMRSRTLAWFWLTARTLLLSCRSSRTLPLPTRTPQRRGVSSFLCGFV